MEATIGLGDQLIGTGLARGAAAKGQKVAFGDGQEIIWDHHSHLIFRDNPNIAAPGSEFQKNLHWISFYRGSRIYNRHDTARNRWEWNYEFRVTPGEIFLDEKERAWAKIFGHGQVIIEPNVPHWKPSSANKQWDVLRYDKIARNLGKKGWRVAQFVNGGHTIARAQQIKAPSFRHAMAVLSRAALYIGPEGGLHHAAAAVGIPAVVLFGGFIPPQVTGYDMHTNLTGGAEACGSLEPCDHCKQTMDRIKPDEVWDAAMGYLNG